MKDKIKKWLGINSSNAYVDEQSNKMFREMSANRDELIKETNSLWKKVDSNDHELDKALRRIKAFEEYLGVDWFMEKETSFGYKRNFKKQTGGVIEELENLTASSYHLSRMPKLEMEEVSNVGI